MSTEDQNDGSDLFDFPEAKGVDSFGFSDQSASGPDRPEPSGEARGAINDILDVDPVPNPPLPAGLGDLDEDLFDFAAAADTDGLSPIDQGDPSTSAARAAGLEVPSDDTQPEAVQALEEPEQPLSPAPAPEEILTAQPALAGPSVPTPPNTPAPQLEVGSGQPVSPARDRNRLLVALGGCFLLVNTGIFFLAQQASDRFNQTIADATGLMAQVLLTQQSSAAQASAPASAEPNVQHIVESPEAPEAQAEEARDLEVLVDPLKYDNSHQLAVGRAKALIEEGKPEDARMLLNFVLANRDRVPLTNSLREEIDYLIPFTYAEQGRAVAPEDAR